MASITIKAANKKGRVLKVSRTASSKASNCDSGLTEQQLQHPSETAMDDYHADCYIINDSTLYNLEVQVPEILKAIGG